MRIVAVVGNPRPESRTHRIASAIADALAAAAGVTAAEPIDLAVLGSRVLDPDDADATAAAARLVDADLAVVASPTYKATYTGLLKGFLDRVPTGALAPAASLPVLVGGAPNHSLAVDVHLTPLLLELGASVPVRGLFVLDSVIDETVAGLDDWVAGPGAALVAR